MSRMGIISEYGIGFTILTAGLPDAINPLAEALLSVFVPAVEEAARDEAEAYIGNFSTPINATLKSNLTLGIDDGPGLKTTEFFSNSTDMLAGLTALRGFWPGSFGPPPLDFRIYPAGISETTRSNETIGTGTLTREDWRIVMDPLLGPNESQLPSQKVYDSICTTWQGHDALYYGGKPVDQFVFLKKGDEVVGVEIPFLRVTLMKW